MAVIVFCREGERDKTLKEFGRDRERVRMRETRAARECIGAGVLWVE